MGKFWKLDELGTLAPNRQKEIKRRGQPTELNNNGDLVELVNSSGNVMQTVTFGRAEENEVIEP